MFRRRTAPPSGSDQYLEYAAQDVGLVHGAMVLSLDGVKQVEHLGVGDRIITHDAGVSRLTHIQRHQRPVEAIVIPEGALGDTRPNCDVVLPAAQRIIIGGGLSQYLFGTERALVAAATLTGSNGIHDPGLQERVIYQLFCKDPHILFCDGLELGTADAARARATAFPIS